MSAGGQLLYFVQLCLVILCNSMPVIPTQQKTDRHNQSSDWFRNDNLMLFLLGFILIRHAAVAELSGDDCTRLHLGAGGL